VLPATALSGNSNTWVECRQKYYHVALMMVPSRGPILSSV